MASSSIAFPFNARFPISGIAGALAISRPKTAINAPCGRLNPFLYKSFVLDGPILMQ
jgi:hypothetical protein